MRVILTSLILIVLIQQSNAKPFLAKYATQEDSNVMLFSANHDTLILLDTINALRKDYHAWLEYIKDKPDKYTRYATDEERTIKKIEWFDVLCSKFPNLKEEREQILVATQKAKDAAEKFNGNLVSEWTGLTGKELGEALKDFKVTFGSKDAYTEWASTVTAEEAKEHFMRTHNKDLDIEI